MQEEITLPENGLNGLSVLRQQLIQLNVWPDAGDQFLALMPRSQWHASPLTETDEQWLPQVVEDATKGVDIGATYPAFFQKLLTSDTLRQSFLNALNVKLRAS
ncbi:MAG: hypothetical protein GY803_01455 [Chloroflexi bacterium]|nr:hypothetical protein [Chloroflexota bacterium]